jgi:integrase
LPWLDNFERSKKPRRLPVVLTVPEVQPLLREAASAPAPINLIIKLLYGTGMRLMEAVRLRVKDVELARKEIIIRDGKGGKDRVTMLPDSLLEAIRAQLVLRRAWHEQDMALNKVDVWLVRERMRYPVKDRRILGKEQPIQLKDVVSWRKNNLSSKRMSYPGERTTYPEKG